MEDRLIKFRDGLKSERALDFGLTLCEFVWTAHREHLIALKD